MVKYAKLDESKLTDITQALYYPIEANNGDDIRLLELNPHIMSQIREGQVLSFKGGLNEKLVLCTDSKTYDVKEAEISNSLLLVPDLKHSQATSKSPLKSPRGNVNNRSLEKSFENEEDDVPMGTPSNRKLESRHVIKICHEYFECREINPRFRKLSELLLLTRYSGPENEYCIDRKLLFRFDQLLDTIQCSRLEFIDGLKKYRAIEIDSRIRVLEYEYEYRTISHMLGLINENSWKLDEIDRTETINALKGIVPLAVVEGLFDLYTEKSTTDGQFNYREDMVCRIIAENILQQGLKFHINDFITTWQDALPEGMKIDVKLIYFYFISIYIYYVVIKKCTCTNKHFLFSRKNI